MEIIRMSDGMATVRITIDGQEVTVPAKKLAYDPLAKKKVEIDTTVYDAALALSQQTGKPNPIPILCHREHINPVAVCRVCTVDVGGFRLAPACYLPVSEASRSRPPPPASASAPASRCSPSC